MSTEAYRRATESAGMDVVLREAGTTVELVLDHHGNGTSETAALDFRGLVGLRAAIGHLVRERTGRATSLEPTWRGSVRDLLGQLEPLLSTNELQELACETALLWRKRKDKA